MVGKYIKNGIIASNVIILGDQLIINPTDDLLLLAGYKKVIEDESILQTPAESPSDDYIKSEREKQYRMRSDSYFIAYLKYLALDLLDKAEEAKRLWLEEIEKINNEYPYGTN